MNAAKEGDSRILVVDDNELALDAISDLLEREGFSVRTARSGVDALCQAKGDGDIRLIVLDLWMPVMDGWEFLRRKKNDAMIADIPVIVLSAVPPVALDGADAVLRKPVDTTPLFEAVRRYC